MPRAASPITGWGSSDPAVGVASPHHPALVRDLGCPRDGSTHRFVATSCLFCLFCGPPGASVRTSVASLLFQAPAASGSSRTGRIGQRKYPVLS